MHKGHILFQPMGKRIPADETLTILETANRAGVGIEASCGGKGRCGRCRVKVNGSLPPPGELERDFIDENKPGGYRLACQTQAQKDLSVWIPETSRLGDQIILTQGADYTADFAPSVSSLELDIPLQAPKDPALIRQAEKLGSYSGKATAITTRSGRIIDVSPGREHHCYGLAVDLGTTTVVAYLMDLHTGKLVGIKADMNPQITEAEDVISRISLCLEHPKSLQKLSSMAKKCIEKLAASICREHGIEMDRIFDCTIVGNTAMHHILLGLNPEHLSVTPYTPVVSGPLNLSTAELGFDFSPKAQLHIPPVKAGFVGADAVAMALALNADQVSEPTLMVDLGTNGEIVLATPDRILCCSTAAGPAFEGGHIRWGMRGAPGAVEMVELDEGHRKPVLSVIGDTAPQGICGSGLVSLVSGLIRTGTVTASGGFDLEHHSHRLRQGTDGIEYLLAEAKETQTGRDLVFTHHDLAQLQMAKAAIHAGISLMMTELGINKLPRVMLAGAFGNYLDKASACGINMLPGVSPDQIVSAGNAAGKGAVMVLMDYHQRSRAQNLADKMQYIELAGHPDFNTAYLDGMAFR